MRLVVSAVIFSFFNHFSDPLTYPHKLTVAKTLEFYCDTNLNERPVPRSEFETATDIRQTPVHGCVIGTVLLSSAKRRLLASGKNYSSRSHCCYYCDMSKRKNPVDADVALVPQSTISCPKCGHRETETMPTEYCQFYYECKGCGTLLHPNQGDCCVYCSFGTTPCPPIQKARQKGNGSASCCEP